MNTTNICKLCKVNPATQTGSHILPFSLIREAISYLGSSKRDKEASFGFSSRKSPTLYTGRSVLPEQIEEVRSDAENITVIDKNPTTEDYIFCPECEHKFSVVESFYSIKVIDVLNKDKDLFSNANPLINNFSDQDILPIRIYIYGLFWRASISTVFKSFSLKNADEETMRVLLNDCMSADISKLMYELEYRRDLINSFPLIILYSQGLDDPTGSINYCEVVQPNPYFILANRFAFLIFFSKPPLDLSPYMYSINQYTQMPELINTDNKPLVFRKLFKHEWQGILRNIIESVKNSYLEDKEMIFISAYKLIFDRAPSVEQVRALRLQVAALGVNTDDKQILDLINKYMTTLPEVKRLL